MNTDLENGLPSDEQARLASTVSLIQSPSSGFFKLLLKACNNYTVWLLVLVAGLSLLLGINGMTDGLLDGVITIAVIILIVLHNYLELHLLQKQKPSEMHRKVIAKREGQEKEVSSSDVLIGEIVSLERDRLVPADGLFFNSGESLNLELDDGSTIDANKPLLFYGAKVTGGFGGMLVTSVGTDTTLGQLMTQVTQAPVMNPLPAELDKVNTVLQIAGLLIPILILFVLFLCVKLGDEDVCWS